MVEVKDDFLQFLLSLLRSGDVGHAIDCIESEIGVSSSDTELEDNDSSNETSEDTLSPEVLQELCDSDALIRAECPIDKEAGIYKIYYGRWVGDEIQKELPEIEQKNCAELAAEHIIL